MEDQLLKDLGFTGAIFTPTSPAYGTANQRYSHNAILRPTYILQPRDIPDLPRAIQFARSQKLEIAVKGGGAFHYAAASSNGGVVIDLAKMDQVVVSEDKKSVSVGGGAKWGDVYAETDKHGVVPVGGDVHFVGVGGYTLGGGYSRMSGKYGLGIDNILKATVVLADGKIVETSEESEPDLFWAIRGGVNQFGIVAELVLKLYPMPGPVTVGPVVFPGTQFKEVLAATHEHLENHDPSTKLILMFARAPPDFHPAILILPYIENNSTPPDTVLAPFRELAQPVFEGIQTVDTFTAVSHAIDKALEGAPPRVLMGGALFSALWDDTFTETWVEWVKFTEQPEFRFSALLWEFGHPGKIAEKKFGDTAFAARGPHYYFVVCPRYAEASDDQKAAEWASKLSSRVSQAQVEKTGKKLPTPASFALSPEAVSVEDMYGENLPRLRQLKAKYDPEKIWNRGWVIEPASS